jgi:hypothetical protein
MLRAKLGAGSVGKAMAGTMKTKGVVDYVC